MGDIRLLRTPLPGSFIGQLTPMASIGLQARGLGDALILAGKVGLVSIVTVAGLVILLLGGL